MIAYSPDSFYNMYDETFKSISRKVGISEPTISEFNHVWFVNLAAWLLHAIPVWWWSRIYTPGNPTGWIVVYLALFGPYLTDIYPFDITTLSAIGIVAALVLYVGYKMG